MPFVFGNKNVPFILRNCDNQVVTTAGDSDVSSGAFSMQVQIYSPSRLTPKGSKLNLTFTHCSAIHERGFFSGLLVLIFGCLNGVYMVLPARLTG